MNPRRVASRSAQPLKPKIPPRHLTPGEALQVRAWLTRDIALVNGTTRRIVMVENRI